MEAEWMNGFSTALVLPDKEFTNLTRSTVPLVCYWRDRTRALATLAKALDLPDLASAQIEFEAETASVGRAEASHTDVMVRSPTASVAIEAKWSEPVYQTVARWKARVQKPLPVIAHWLKRIRPFAEPPESDGVSGLIYQMLHRCASACEPGCEVAAMVYQVFTDSEHRADPYEKSLKEFVETIRPTRRLRVRLIEVPMKKTPQYHVVERSLAQRRLRDPRFLASRVVRHAVARGELFDFLEPVVREF
jgi:hypothetical protein